MERKRTKLIMDSAAQLANHKVPQKKKIQTNLAKEFRTSEEPSSPRYNFNSDPPNRTSQKDTFFSSPELNQNDKPPHTIDVYGDDSFLTSHPIEPDHIQTISQSCHISHTIQLYDEASHNDSNIENHLSDVAQSQSLCDNYSLSTSIEPVLGELHHESLEEVSASEYVLCPLTTKKEKTSTAESVSRFDGHSTSSIAIVPASSEYVLCHLTTKEQTASATEPLSRFEGSTTASNGILLASSEYVLCSLTTNEQTTSTKDHVSQTDGLSTSCRSTRKKAKVAYLDYLSDDEALIEEVFGGGDDSDLWEEVSSSSENSDCESRKQKKRKIRKKKSFADDEKDQIVGETANIEKKSNKRKQRKEAKQSGKEYTNYSGVIVAAKQVNPNPCLGKKCGNNCDVILEERRKQIFDHFWNLRSDRRKDWIVGLTQKIPVKRKRSAESEKRQFTFKYYINDGEGKRPVCLQFLCKTLDVSQKYIYYTVSNAKFGSAKDDLRGKCIPPNKTKEHVKLTVINFIKNLPALPSHYCRKDSTRVYLPQEFKNLSNLYQLYRKNYMDQGVDIVGERVFRNIFLEDFNIGFHVPKKDKCLKCLKFERADKTDETMKEARLAHMTEKNDSYNRFKAHQNIYKTDPNTLCVSFDLQKVLNTPNGESMLLYYSRKLSVYNLTFYESGTRKVFCFYWDEVNGKRGANEIATILHRYITIIDKRESVKRLLLYCDCCPGQNRNRTVLAMIHSTLQNCRCIEVIQINFLLTGHTYMPVDSVHAVIEKSIKNSIIWAPSQWYTVFGTARQDPWPYNVEVLTFKDFNKWDVLGEKYFKGNLTGKVSKIRIATFRKKDNYKISIKNSMSNEAPCVDVEVQPKSKGPPSACYKALLPISKQKYDALIKLCRDTVVPPLFHHEYVNIPISSNVKDTLPETDLEDEELE